MKKLIWRLSRLPEPSELQGLVKDKIITQEEAREILFKEKDETEPVPKADELKSEIEFLRKLVEKLSNGRVDTITNYITTYPNPNRWYWYQPYVTWCSSITPSLTATSGYCSTDFQNSCTAGTATQTGGLQYTTMSNNTLYASAGGDASGFSEIKTF